MKHCAGCKELKPAEAFSINRRAKTGLEVYCKVCRSERHKERYEKNLFSWMAKLKRSECKKKNIEFNLTEEYLKSIWTGYCPIFGTKLRINDKSHRDQYALDRIVPSKGYVIGNVCFMSSRANRIKYDADENELQKIADWLRSVKEGSTTIP